MDQIELTTLSDAELEERLNLLKNQRAEMNSRIEQIRSLEGNPSWVLLGKLERTVHFLQDTWTQIRERERIAREQARNQNSPTSHTY